MSDRLEKHPHRDQLLEAFSNSVSMRRIVEMGLASSKSVAHRLYREWQAARPSVHQPSQEFARTQLRRKALREHAEELLRVAMAKNDVPNATKLLKELSTLDRQIIDVQARNPEQTTVRIVYTGTDGAGYPASAYIGHIISMEGWETVLRLCLERMCESDKASEKIKLEAEKFVATLLAEKAKNKDVALVDDSGNVAVKGIAGDE